MKVQAKVTFATFKTIVIVSLTLSLIVEKIDANFPNGNAKVAQINNVVKQISENELSSNRLREKRAADCEPGYEKGWFGKCYDIDECADSANNECGDSQCVNTLGSYTCVEPTTTTLTPKSTEIGETGSCANGYHKSWWNKCVDIDECKQAGICGNDRCENAAGSYRCVREEQQQMTQCNSGFFYSKLSGKCEDIDECALELDNCMESICENTIGSFQCNKQQCYAGFEYTTAGCVDIDECQRLGDGACSRDETCHNSKGSFICQKCIRGDKELHCYRRRQCMPGYEPSKLIFYPCVDVDECQKGFHTCSEIEECVNTVPGYRCDCIRGYTRNLKGDCAEDHSSCGVDNVCPDLSIPNPCPTGLEISANRLRCEDIDECSQNLCDSQSECRNYRGGYRCYVKQI